MPKPQKNTSEQLFEKPQLEFDQLLGYKALLEFFNDGVLIKNTENKVVFVNEPFCTQLGYTVDEIFGTSGYQLLANKKYEKLIDDKMKLRKKGVTDTYDIQVRAKTGELLWWRVTGRPFFDKNGNFVGSISIFSDITKQRTAEEELRRTNDEFESLVNLRTRELTTANNKLLNEIKERKIAQIVSKNNEQQFRDIFNSSPDAIYVEDLNGTILDVNNEACNMHGKSREELIGKNIFDLTPDSQYEAVKTRQPLLAQGEMRVFESQALNSEGKIIPIEVKVSRFTHNGNPALLLHVRDISDRVKSQQLMHKINVELETKVRLRTHDLETANKTLRISENLYRQIARNIPRSAIFVFDNNLRYLLAEGNLIGFISLNREHIEGKSIYDLFTEEQLKEVEHIYKWTIEGISGSYELEQNNLTYQINYLPIRNDDGDIIYGMLMVMDITDLKKTQQKLEKQTTELKRSNEELERFAYIASHDLQGPLRTISSYLQLLESRYSNRLEGDAKEFIEYSVAGAKRMQRLIQDLLNYSRINTRPKPFADTNLNDLVKVVLKNLETTIQTNHAEIRTDELPMVFGDSNQLMQLFQNLIDNAIKFVKNRQPIIVVNVENHQKEWLFAIRDNGIGIEPEFKEKIFQIFQRLHAETEFPGTGIGLAICKKIVHLHGGDIWFESEPGQGTAFFFTISKSLNNLKN
ncbi:MAG: PAS domain S-box protein [Chitinophagales bacterium]|nr:PAS domain S-box protein [Chitinophagales bacterium]